MSELRMHSSTLESVRTALARGHAAVEEPAAEAPKSVDAGDVTPLVLAVVTRLLDNAASISEGLAVLADQVTQVHAHLRTTDVELEMDYRRAGVGVR